MKEMLLNHNLSNDNETHQVVVNTVANEFQLHHSQQRLDYIDAAGIVGMLLLLLSIGYSQQTLLVAMNLAARCHCVQMIAASIVVVPSNMTSTMLITSLVTTGLTFLG